MRVYVCDVVAETASIMQPDRAGVKKDQDNDNRDSTRALDARPDTLQREERSGRKETHTIKMFRQFGSRSAAFATATTSARFTTSSLDQVFLHVGPSGDCWTGSSIYAAKHLQPDYVKSIPIPPHVCVDTLMDKLEGDEKLMQKVYDDGAIPPNLLQESKPPDET